MKRLASYLITALVIAAPAGIALQANAAPRCTTTIDGVQVCTPNGGAQATTRGTTATTRPRATTTTRPRSTTTRPRASTTTADPRRPIVGRGRAYCEQRAKEHADSVARAGTDAWNKAYSDKFVACIVANNA